MKIDTHVPWRNSQPLQNRREPAGVEDQRQSGGIGEQVKKALDNVNTMQQSADTLVEQVALGNTEETHKAVISMEKALLALNFTLSVRNKALEAYQEIMRTQV